MEFGDCAFWGEGEDGQAVSIGVERKVINDLVASMRSNRLSGHQLPGLMNTYDVVYLLVEGAWRAGEGGAIEVPVKGGWRPMMQNVLYREVEHYLATLEHKCGVQVIFTSSRAQTAAWIVSRFKWWQKQWDKHDSCRAVYVPDIRRKGKRFGFMRAGPVETFASLLPGIGKKAFEFNKQFKTVEEVVKASALDLQKVDGVGKKGAEKIYLWIRGGGV